MASAKASTYMKAGEKSLKKWGFFSGNDKYEEASASFEKAGIQFKLAKDWTSAGEAYEKAALADMQCGNELDAARHYTEAASCLKNVSASAAIEKYKEAQGIFEDAGNLGQAAKSAQAIAELYEADMNVKEAGEYFGAAADLYKASDSTSKASTCFLKVAEFQSDAADYPKAIEVFDSVGKSYVANNLLKYKARDLFLNAIICHLAAGDPVAADRALKEYSEVDPLFDDTRQSELATETLQAFVDASVEDFVAALTKFDAVSRLDPWRSKMLLRIKKTIQEAGAVDLT